eukprot:TRINITY_DN24268_c0_g1_i2.p1 TRINITY_DN24268_c0_g1~~TRINITY_DN24268_c0_g1_i2.p1  ORF type:complete len:133 (-),score=12.19 TRINITY_DN24268_c0_g1_i2:740-1111(-)
MTCQSVLPEGLAASLWSSDHSERWFYGGVDIAEPAIHPDDAPGTAVRTKRRRADARVKDAPSAGSGWKPSIPSEISGFEASELQNPYEGWSGMTIPQDFYKYSYGEALPVCTSGAAGWAGLGD